ncbi:phycobiliprotein lyase [Cyanobium sp. AMD-g]|uniref:phycobiliprotein lyase n=1 Tax=Cyanobium sp. AMD-g TaxID=2823699 RepID=UPI0020CE27C1|nr:phycobiliprotein lyase [Cyanobium sp. AMD-g]MCP9931312.1 phycobiliprotein lyase [Cyanobium sp. AMD-g]
MTSATEPSTPATIAPFPPETIAAFLALCAGDWLALRSRFSLEEASDEARQAEEEEEVSWHSSERGELQVTYMAPEELDGPGGLEISPPSGGRHRLLFQPDGGFQGQAPDGAVSTGRWQLWPDGSLELSSERAGTSVRERIWFTKANLRLRSSVEHLPDGRPGRASFSSEIRRVSRPAG